MYHGKFYSLIPKWIVLDFNTKTIIIYGQKVKINSITVVIIKMTNWQNEDANFGSAIDCFIENRLRKYFTS